MTKKQLNQTQNLMQGSFPALWRYSSGVFNPLTMQMDRLTNVTCRAACCEAHNSVGPSMKTRRNCVVLLNTRVIKMILKAFLFMLFWLSPSLSPSPGPGCFSTQRTWTLQYNMRTRKNRDTDMSR